MKLVAVVLNWNGGDDTLAALASLGDVPTICVDNGSTDGSDLAVEERFPDVELIRTGANLGFAGGNNVGIRRALERGADWMLLLNNDAVAEPGLPEALERAAEVRPDAGLLACPSSVRTGARCSTPARRFNRGSATPAASRRTPPSSAARRRPRRRRGDRGLARGGSSAPVCSTTRCSSTSRTSTGRCASARGLRRRPRARCARPAQGIRGDRRARVDDEPLLRHAEHDRRSTSGTPRCRRVYARCVAASSSRRTSRRRRRMPRGSTPRAPCLPAGAMRAPGGSVREARGRPRRSRAPSRPTRTAPRARARGARHSSGAASTSSTASAIARGSLGSNSRAASPTVSGSAAGVRRRDRAAAGHRLERRQAEALVERREHERRRALHQATSSVGRHLAAHLDAVGHGREVAAAGEHEPQLGPLTAQERERLEQPLVVLVRPAARRDRAGTARAPLRRV